MEITTTKNNRGEEMKNTKITEGAYVRVHGKGFIHEIEGLTRVGNVIDYNEDHVLVSFVNGEEDWYEKDQVDVSLRSSFFYYDNQKN